MNTTLQDFNLKNISLHIFDDFNLVLMKISASNHIHQYMYAETLISCLCKCLNSSPTITTYLTRTILDNKSTADKQSLVSSGILMYDYADHLPTFAVISKVKSKKLTYEVILHRNTKNFKPEKILEQLAKSFQVINWKALKLINDKMFEFFSRFNPLNLAGPKIGLAEKPYRLTE